MSERIAHPNAGRYDHLHGDEDMPPEPTEDEIKAEEEAAEWLTSAIVRDCLSGVYGFDWLWANDQYEQLVRDVQEAATDNYDGTKMFYVGLGRVVEAAIIEQAELFARSWIEESDDTAERMEWLAEHDEDRRKEIKRWLKGAQA